jgi:hypothetical protein
MEFKETGCGLSNNDMAQWQDLADVAMNFWFHKG